MKILLRPYLKKDIGGVCTLSIIRELLKLGAVPMLERATAEQLENLPEGCALGEYGSLLQDCDVLMPVGGDGTLMRAACNAVWAEKPIIGVNAGRVGFLTQLEACETEKLHLLVEGRYSVTERMLLEGAIGGGPEAQSFIALNDIVVSRGSAEGIADVEVHQKDGRLITRQRGDGLIIATPTGSTAYSLSAGGPVVDPELELFLLTAICPHATFRCALVLPSTKEYTVREHVVNRETGLYVSADGRRVAKISSPQELTVRKFQKCLRFIDLGVHGFYDNLSEKLRWRT